MDKKAYGLFSLQDQGECEAIALKVGSADGGGSHKTSQPCHLSLRSIR